MKTLVVLFFLLLPTWAWADEVSCLATVIHNEARGTTEREKLRVAEVVLNRKKSSKYKNTVCGVVNQKGQFNNSRVSNTTRKAWKDSKKLAKEILSGQKQTTRSGALYFHNYSVKPSWSKQKRHVVSTPYHQYYK